MSGWYLPACTGCGLVCYGGTTDENGDVWHEDCLAESPGADDQ